MTGVWRFSVNAVHVARMAALPTGHLHMSKTPLLESPRLPEL